MREFSLRKPDSDHSIRGTCHSDERWRRGRLCALLNQLPERITASIGGMDDSDGVLTVEWEHPPDELNALTIEALWDGVFGQGIDSVRHVAPDPSDWTARAD